MKQIRIATSADDEYISRLRLAEYSRSSGFRLIDPTEIAKIRSGTGAVLAAFEDGFPISTMKGTILWETDRLEAILECYVSVPEVKLPALVLTRAATARSHRSSGLNTALRYYFLSAAQDRVGCVLGAVYAGAPRLGVMRSIGYDFFAVDSWEVDIQPCGQRCLAVLRGERISGAATILRLEAEAALSDYPWSGPSLEDVPDFRH